MAVVKPLNFSPLMHIPTPTQTANSQMCITMRGVRELRRCENAKT